MFEDQHKAHTTSCRSANARPLETELIRTACSLIPETRDCSSRRRILVRASTFLPDVTESSRSYATVSADKDRDLSSIFWDDPGTEAIELVVEWWVERGGVEYHIAMPVGQWRQYLSPLSVRYVWEVQLESPSNSVIIESDFVFIDSPHFSSARFPHPRLQGSAFASALLVHVALSTLAIYLCLSPSIQKQESAMEQPRQGDLSWRLSSHPVTLLCFLSFRICK